jgi:transposase-like protein
MSSAGVFMSQSESYKYQIVNKFLCGKLYREEASRLLNVSERSITRYAKSITKLGVLGIKHGNYGRKYKTKYSVSLKQQVIDLFKSKYMDFNLTHFSEILENTHEIKINYNTLWKWFSSERLIKNPRRKRRKKHMYRPRLPQEGLMLQMDGCHHRFNGKDEWCLISAIDDATSEIPYAEFFKGETTVACMKVLKNIIELKGVPKAIYTDRAGWAGGNKRTEFCNFKTACDKLGIQILFANSPEAKGRIERSFRTFQDRLVPELRISNITKMNEANTYLRDVFLKKYWNEQKVIAPMNPETAYEPLSPWLKLDEIMCLIEERKVGSDHTTSFKGKRYLIIPQHCSVAGYMASFKTNLEGKVRVFVMDQEVKTKVVTTRQYSDVKVDPSVQISNPLLYRGMYALASNLYGAVWKHKATGKPIQFKKFNKKKVA